MTLENLHTKMFKVKNLLFLIFYLILYSRCDIPVKCQSHQIQGEWIFRISSDIFQPSLENPKSSCTHGFPDKVDNTEGDVDYSFKEYKDILVTLNSDYKVYEENVEIGTWTPIYNEGFIANFKNSEYMAFSKYYKKQGSYISNCDKTMIGWYIPNVNQHKSNWSCFFGFKSKLKKSFSSRLIQMKSFLKRHNHRQTQLIENRNIQMFYKNDPIFLETKSRASSKSMKYDDRKDYVDKINNSDSTWKAGFNDFFKGMTFAEIYRKMGSKSNFATIDTNLSEEQSFLEFKSSKLNSKSTKNKEKIKTKKHILLNQSSYSEREVDSKDITNLEDINKYQNVPIDEIDTLKLPLNWDWRNVGGVNFVPPTNQQGNCGSCYVFATIEGLETQLRILTLNKDKTLFSKQYTLSCSPFTEGCHGGYPILVAKFAKEFDLISEECFPYKENDTDCSRRCDNSKSRRKYSVSKYGYIGGYYGAATEELMMKEIRAHGPIPGNLNPPWNFSYYRSGVYMFYNKVAKNNGKISKISMADQDVDWLQVEHSTLIVGWGEENGIKYWICLNTWGESFGEGGFFKILRGENECNIETMGEFYRLKIEDQ